MCDGQQTTARSFHPCTYSLITDRPIDSVCISMIGGQAKAHLDNSPSSPAWKSDSSISACAAWLIRAVVAGLKTLIPRRLDEPTGPFELVSWAADLDVSIQVLNSRPFTNTMGPIAGMFSQLVLLSVSHRCRIERRYLIY